MQLTIIDNKYKLWTNSLSDIQIVYLFKKKQNESLTHKQKLLVEEITHHSPQYFYLKEDKSRKEKYNF